MKNLIEEKQRLAEARLLPDELQGKLGRKIRKWSDAPTIHFDKLSKDERLLIRKLDLVPWEDLYTEWPSSVTITNFTDKPDDPVFILDGDDNNYYLIATEGHGYARYVGKLSKFRG